MTLPLSDNYGSLENIQRQSFEEICRFTQRFVGQMGELEPSRQDNTRKNIPVYVVARSTFIDALVTLQAGDFGNIDGKSGDFIYEGNIYDDSELSTIAQNYPPKHAPGKDELILIKSYDAKSTAQEPGVEG